MKTIEFNPDSKPTTIPPGDIPGDDLVRNELLVEALPLILHKLKNRLTPILGYTQILLSRTGDEFFKERLARIERNTADLADALNTLKDSCKPATVRRQPEEISLILEGLAAQWQAIAATNGVRIVIEQASGLPVLALDAGQLRILLLSLADNAVNALKMKKGEDREIRISTRLQGPSLELAIRDNGCGMSEEETGSIWMPFYSKFPGHAGLGLVLCERIIANHDAACTVISVPGEFSQFVIAFPLAATTDVQKKKSDEKNIRSQS